MIEFHPQSLPATHQMTTRPSSTELLMKQIGLAFYNYHDTHTVFPVNYAMRNLQGNTNDGPGIANSTRSWLQMILPYVEQANLYNKIDFNGTGGTWPSKFVNNPNNQTIAQTALQVYLCPSEFFVSCVGDHTSVTGSCFVFREERHGQLFW